MLFEKTDREDEDGNGYGELLFGLWVVSLDCHDGVGVF